MLPSGVRLIHIRHGETDFNAEGRLQGQRDTPMNDRGRRQAAGNAQRLASWFAAESRAPESFAWVCSPLGRTRETMRIVREVVGLPEEAPTDPRLMEVSFGDWSGFTYAELSAAGEHDAVLRRKRDKWSFVPPAGESYAGLAERIGGWLAEVTRDTVLVAHGGVHRVLHGHLAGTPWHEVPEVPVPQDKVFMFRDGRVETL